MTTEHKTSSRDRPILRHGSYCLTDATAAECAQYASYWGKRATRAESEGDPDASDLRLMATLARIFSVLRREE